MSEQANFYGNHSATLTAESLLSRIDMSLDLETLRYAVCSILDAANNDAESNLAVAICHFAKTGNACYLSAQDRAFLCGMPAHATR